MLRKIFPFLREEEEKWNHLDNALTGAFGKVRQDTQNLFAWISYFHQHLMEHKRETHHLRLKFEEQNRHIQYLQESIKHLEKKIELLDAKPLPQPQIIRFSEQNPNLVRTESEPSPNLKRPNFERKMLSHIMSKKKPYIIRKMLDIIGESPIATKELERIIVEEQQLCGRTSFYAYLKELRLKKQISLQEKEFSKVIVRN